MGGKAVDAPFWYDHDFIPVVRKTVKAARKMVKLRFCQKRVLEVVRHSYDGEMELVPLAHALECLPQLEHRGHESCTSESCEHAIKDFTSVTQLHTVLIGEYDSTVNKIVFLNKIVCLGPPL